MVNLKVWLLSILLSLVIISLVLVLTPPEQEKFTFSKAPQVIVPIVDSYCLGLEGSSNSSTCSTCRNFFVTSINGTLVKHPDFDTFSSLLYVKNLSNNNLQYHEYTIKEIGGNFIIDIKMNIIYGRDTMTGSSLLTIRLDRWGNVLSTKIPKNVCL
jgi:hypothetical protein